ncbi:MAG: hypothetical protein HQM08_15000 [Candidatus Riflebacteria bacterium]|nr:hypothetical protein [Candidatus Riflebacteria bacterium]
MNISQTNANKVQPVAPRPQPPENRPVERNAPVAPAAKPQKPNVPPVQLGRNVDVRA